MPQNPLRGAPKAQLDRHGYISWPGYVSPSPSFPQTTGGFVTPSVTWSQNLSPATYTSAASLVQK